jgi:hydrogenase nickel incorporation protein HypB
MKPRILEIRQGVLEKNDRLAHHLRETFERKQILVVNLVSGPGTGKTAFLERTMKVMAESGHSVAALVGDLATENDANRLARSGAPVRQIVTAGNCHLEADMVAAHLDGWQPDSLEFLFIENVGNLVCPASYDLGENIRVVLLSVTEGEDKPLKYPVLFNSSDVAILTKYDIAEAVEFDETSTLANINQIVPGMPIFKTSAKTGLGLAEWVAFLVHQRQKIYFGESLSS